MTNNVHSINDNTGLHPVIISASRSTDIPAFYSDWLISRIQAGFVMWKNPFNGQFYKVYFDKARLFVFWTKNPENMIDKLDFFKQNNYNYYFQYSLNNYDGLNYENNLPSIDKRIDTFIRLSEKIGKDKVIWRFDPLIISDSLSIDQLLTRLEYVGDKIHQYTQRLVFSFIDIDCYKKVKKNVTNYHLHEFTNDLMVYFSERLQELNQKWKLKLGTCCESVDLDKFNIEHNRCIDDRLIIKLFEDDTALMNFIGYDRQQLTIEDMFNDNGLNEKQYNKIKDKGQRQSCGCIKSKDIGQYDTCPHGCIYCYANTSHETAKNNYQNYLKNRHKDTIV